jgi:asparagine synthase (glutamine-hydrolysing)
MQDSDSGAVIVFNGEIYNHVELRDELRRAGYRFRGHSDTEVLLYALLEWGESALSRLNGMWALAFWNPTSNRLFLSRDRFGVKPLYYRIGPEGLAFASEPKALLALFPQHRRVAEDVVLDFLGNNRLYDDGRSFYEGVHVLPPAHFGWYSPHDTKLALSRYWNYPEEVDGTLSDTAAVEQFEAMFTDAVRLRLRSDVPVGVTLSGGLDSTAVLTAAAGQPGGPLTCFTSVYGDGETGELHWAKLASQAAASPLIAVPAPAQDWLDTLKKVAWHMDGPGYSPAVYPLWHLMRRARQEGVPVLLEGQGADEALAGYPQYAVLEFLSYLSGRSGMPRSMAGIGTRAAGLSRTFTLRWSLAWMARELSPAMLRWHRRRVGFQSLLRKDIRLPEAAEVSRVAGDPVRQRLIDDHSRNILPGLLHYGDAVSMAHGIEARNPFLDYRLVEWIFRLPQGMRFRNSETKWVLREYLRNHGQRSIGDRPDKKGYPTPVGKWLASGPGQEIESIVLDRQSQLLDWCDPQKIRRLFQQNRNGVLAAEHHLYKIISTRLWLSECIEGACRP